MKKNLFVITENERERILNMHKTATKKNYLSEATMAAKPADVKGFQQWVINQKKDTAILGKGGSTGYGDDGVYGGKTQAAWTKYGQEYTDAYGGASPQQAIQKTAIDKQGWLSYPCIVEAGTEYTTKNGYVIYKLSPGYAVVWDSTNKKPALFSGIVPGSTAETVKFERFIDCNDRSLVNVKQDRTAADDANWAAWGCITSVGTKRVTSDGWVVYDYPNNQYVYFDDITKKPALADTQKKEKIRDLECTDPVIAAASGATTGTTTATTTGATTQFVGLSKLPADIQDRITKWAQTPDGTYILSLAANQREAGLDMLEKRRGGLNPETRALKKEIRTALGMAADNLLGRLQQSVSGAIQGAKTGFAGGQNP